MNQEQMAADARKYVDGVNVELSSELYDASKSTLEISFETKNKSSDETWMPIHHSDMQNVWTHFSVCK